MDEEADTVYYDPSLKIVLGEAFIFLWQSRELTGVAVRHVNKWVNLRTKSSVFSVPESDVLRRA